MRKIEAKRIEYSFDRLYDAAMRHYSQEGSSRTVNKLIEICKKYHEFQLSYLIGKAKLAEFEALDKTLREWLTSDSAPEWMPRDVVEHWWLSKPENKHNVLCITYYPPEYVPPIGYFPYPSFSFDAPCASV